MVQVTDLIGTFEAHTLDELERLLEARNDDGANAFWLAHEDSHYPVLCLLVKGSLASILYSPNDRQAGFIPQNPGHGLTKEEFTRFAISRHSGDDVFVLNEAILAVATAMQAAKEFFLTKELPRSVEWLEL